MLSLHLQVHKILISQQKNVGVGVGVGVCVLQDKLVLTTEFIL